MSIYVKKQKMSEFEKYAEKQKVKDVIRKNKYLISWSLLNAGTINVKTGESTNFNVIENAGGDGFLVLMKGRSLAENWYIASSAGESTRMEKSDPVGSTKNIISYLDGRQIGKRLIVGYFPTTTEGLEKIHSIVGKTTVNFSVFK